MSCACGPIWDELVSRQVWMAYGWPSQSPVPVCNDIYLAAFNSGLEGVRERLDNWTLDSAEGYCRPGYRTPYRHPPVSSTAPAALCVPRPRCQRVSRRVISHLAVDTGGRVGFRRVSSPRGPPGSGRSARPRLVPTGHTETAPTACPPPLGRPVPS